MPTDYKDVESMLFRGFITAEVEVVEVPIVFKTLNHSEYDLIDLHSFSLSNEWEHGASYFLAYSTLFFNHVNVLHKREEHITNIAEHYKAMPKSLLVALLKVTAGINKRSATSLQQLQGYSCGATSRQMWRMYKDIPLCDPMVTGFTGTASLGLNMHQRMWVYFNTLEDDEADYLKDYGLAKFVVSPHAPKDIKRMDARDQKKIRDRDKRKKALYQGDNYVTEEADQIYVTNESAEELLAQMKKENQGEKDFHDHVIEQHRRTIRAAYLHQREEQRQRAEEAQRKRLRQEIEEDYRELSREGYSQEEIEHYLKRADQQRRLRRLERPDDYRPLEEKEERLIRWGFLDEDDIPETRRHFYDKSKGPKEENFENPLIKEHYERVSDDLKTRRVHPLRSDTDEES